MAELTETHGWTAVPRSLDKLIASRVEPKPSQPVQVEDIPLPDTALVKQVMQYAKAHLSVQTFNHSMRVFYYGTPYTNHQIRQSS